MADRSAEVGFIGRHFTGSGYVDFDEPAPIAGGITGKRLQLGYRLAELFNGYARKSLEKARESCPNSEGDGCELELYRATDDGGDTSAAIYHCPDAGELCGEVAITAAATTTARVDRVVRNVSEIIEQQFDSEVDVTLRMPQQVD